MSINLNSLRIGKRLGQGQQGDVYEVRNKLREYQFELVFKKYNSDVQFSPVILSNLCDFREGLPDSDRDFIDCHTTWPLRLVEDTNGTAIGFLMRRVDSCFFLTDGNFSELQLLTKPDAKFVNHHHFGVDYMDRIRLAINLAQIFDFLHDKKCIFGDLSLKNALWSPRREANLADRVFQRLKNRIQNPLNQSLEVSARILLIDCDPIRKNGGRPAVYQTDSPFFEPPEGGGPLQNYYTDRYKLALCILKILSPGLNNQCKGNSPGHYDIISNYVSPKCVDLIKRSLDANLRPDERSKPHEYIEQLESEISNPQRAARESKSDILDILKKHRIASRTNPNQTSQQTVSTPTYLWQSVASLVFCCLPFSIPAIVKGVQVASHLKSGNSSAAQTASASAKRWMYTSFIAGLLVFMFYFGPLFFSLTGSASKGRQDPVRVLSHGGSIRSASFSPDSKYIVTAGEDSTAKVWEVSTGSLALRPIQHDRWVIWAEFSPDGKKIVTGCHDGYTRIWDSTTGELVLRLDHPIRNAYADTVTFSPDGSFLLANVGVAAEMWGVSTGAIHGKVIPFEEDLYSAFFNSDGTLFVTANYDGTAQIWSTETRLKVGFPMRHKSKIFSARFSPDDRFVVTASWVDGATLWDATTGAVVRRFYDGTETVNSAEFSPDGRWIITTAADRATRVWDASSGNEVISPIRIDGKTANHACFSPDGRWILIDTWKSVHVRETPSVLLPARNLPAGIGTSDLSKSAIFEAGSNRSSGEIGGSVVFSDTSAIVQPFSAWDSGLDSFSAGHLHKHRGSVSSAVFSNDSQLIVTASLDKSAQVWDVVNGNPLGTPFSHQNPVQSALFSPDGTKVVTVSYKTAQIWDVASGDAVGPTLMHEGEVRTAVFSPDGRWIVTASDNAARMWASDTGDSVGRPLPHGNIVYTAAFSPDSMWILTASEDKTAQLWESTTGRAARSTLLHSTAVQSATFTPDGQRIITISGYEVQVWDPVTGERVGQSIEHKARIVCAVPSPDSQFILSASWDNTAKLSDIITGIPLGQPLSHKRALNAAAFSPDGKMVVTGSDDIAQVWSVGTRKPIGEALRHSRRVRSVAFSPDGRWIATASDDSTGRVWKVPSSLVPTTPLKPSKINSLAIDVPPTAAFQQVGQTLEHDNPVNSAVFSPDGRLILTASNDNTVCLWDASSGTVDGQSLQHNDNVNSAAFSPDGRWIITACQDGDALIWDVATRKPIGKPFRHLSGVKSATFSPDGLRIATGSWDETAGIWDVSSGQLIGQTMKLQRSVNSVSFSPDGRWLATADNRFACVWEASSGRQVVALRHPYAVDTAVFSPDGSRLLTASNDRTAKLWAAGTWTQIGNPLQHSSDVFSASFSSDGRWIVTSSLNVAQVWEAATGEPVGDPIHHGGEVRSAAFSPDGRRIVTASTDNAARVWDVPEVILNRSGVRSKVSAETTPVTRPSAPISTAQKPSTGDEIETWTNEQGRTLNAVLVRSNETTATLKDAGGKVWEVPLATLSAESRKRIETERLSKNLYSAEPPSNILSTYNQLFGQIIWDPDLADPIAVRLMASANAGDHEAEALVGEAFYDGIGAFPVNRVEALKWFIRSAKGQNALGKLWIAVMTQNGEISASEPSQSLFQKALPDLVQIIAHQNPIAPYWRATAECYAGGQGIALSERQPRELLEKAIARNDTRARLLRGNMLLQSHGSVGASYLRSASDARCATASTSLAKYYLGRSSEPERAASLLLTAAFKNDIEAQLLLGSCLANGVGTRNDPVEAAFWLETGLINSIRLASRHLESQARESMRNLRSNIGDDNFRWASDFLKERIGAEPATNTKSSG